MRRLNKPLFSFLNISSSLMEAERTYMITAICELALVILLFIGLYTIPVMPIILGAGFLIWLIKR
jgi:hypothetical protein